MPPYSKVKNHGHGNQWTGCDPSIAWCDAAVDGDFLQIAADKCEIKDREVWAGIFDIASNIASYNDRNYIGSCYGLAF